MERFKIPLMRRFLKDERGQSVAVVVKTATALIALTATLLEIAQFHCADPRTR